MGKNDGDLDQLNSICIKIAIKFFLLFSDSTVLSLQFRALSKNNLTSQIVLPLENSSTFPMFREYRPSVEKNRVYHYESMVFQFENINFKQNIQS